MNTKLKYVRLSKTPSRPELLIIMVFDGLRWQDSFAEMCGVSF